MNYLKYGLLVLALSAAFSSDAEYSQITQIDHESHGRVGLHGMVMVTDGVDLYASHLPLYRKPHDYQIVYLVESDYKKQLIMRLTQSKQSQANQEQVPLNIQNMITLLPVKFDLNKLVEGQSFAIETQFFTGHFERGGESWIKDDNFRFVRQVFKRPIANLSATQKLNESNWKALKSQNSDTQLFIHNIQAQPSFDAIILGEKCSISQNSISLKRAYVPNTLELKTGFNMCQSSQILYFESKDFSQ